MPNWKIRQEPLEKTEESRDDYSRDRARIIHSAFFRRLQGKTQVLGLGESDFYRTRLTHSIEVAQIASGIVEAFTNNKSLEEHHTILPAPSLIEAIALAHDIGHPPFGHGGEVALNYVMRNDGGFEGNAQTLRICTKLGEYSKDYGLNLTRRSLLGILKYPVIYDQVVNLDLYNKNNLAPKNIDSFKPPKCVFKCEEKSLEFIFSEFDLSDKDIYQEFDLIPGKHAKTKFKALDTSILELADDIAYGIHDLEDAIALKLVTEKVWRDTVHDQLANSPLGEHIDKITEDLFSGTNKTRKKSISYLVNYFIKNCVISKNDRFTNEFLRTNATLASEIQRELKIIKDFVSINVVKTVEVQTLEYKGQQMIVQLFEAIAANPSRLLLKSFYSEYEKSNEKNRIICDYIAGTTDDYATKLYHKIFTPSSGSIFDRL